jgi:hypothetical protein
MILEYDDHYTKDALQANFGNLIETIKQLANDNAIVDMWYKRFRGCQYPMITLQEALIGMVIGLNGEIKQKEGAKCP